MWIAYGLALFGVYRIVALQNWDALLSYLVFAGCSCLLAVVPVLVNRWYSEKKPSGPSQVSSTQPEHPSAVPAVDSSAIVPKHKLTGLVSTSAPTTFIPPEPKDDNDPTLGAGWRAKYAPERTSLLDLSAMDFTKVGNTVLFHHGEAIRSDTKTVLKYQWFNVINADAASDFLVFYIPFTADTEEVCKYLLTLKDSIRQGAHSFPLPTIIPSGSMEITNTPKTFSNVVYIYHEMELSDEAKVRIRAEYRAQKVEVHFRSQDWLLRKRSEQQYEFLELHGKSAMQVKGNDNTVVGPNQTVIGSGNTIVGPTDSNGNTIFNRGGVAIGNGAQADPTSIAIGAHANAGSRAKVTPK
jgi:hypothetical protein